MKKQGELTVVAQTEVSKDSYELVLSGELVQYMTTPGQFLHVRVDDADDLLLRRPLSIADVNQDRREVTLIYRADGAGTRRLTTKSVDTNIDVLGPLGRGFSVHETKEGETALLVGGGIGVPPLYYLAKQLASRGVYVRSVLGFASVADVFYEEKFRALGETSVTTVDGSHGIKGFVTDAIDQEGIDFDVLYSCGPTPMLKALSLRYHDRRAFISLEERMGCGIGACFACVCSVVNGEKHEYRKICTDGPVFPVGEVLL